MKRQGKSERCSKGVLSGPITKDEEEVVETLFALAGLFADKPKGKPELLDPNPSQVSVSNDSPPAIQGFSLFFSFVLIPESCIFFTCVLCEFCYCFRSFRETRHLGSLLDCH